MLWYALDTRARSCGCVFGCATRVMETVGRTTTPAIGPDRRNLRPDLGNGTMLSRWRPPLASALLPTVQCLCRHQMEGYKFAERRHRSTHSTRLGQTKWPRVGQDESTRGRPWGMMGVGRAVLSRGHAHTNETDITWSWSPTNFKPKRRLLSFFFL